MPSGRYTADSPAIAPPLYLAVNVYRSKSGWMVSTAIKQAGGRSPRTHRRLTTYALGDEPKSLQEATLLAARALEAAAGHFPG